MEPSPLTVIYDPRVFLHKFGADCFDGPIFVWEPIQQQTYTVSKSRYVMTHGSGNDLYHYSMSVTEFGHCAVR